MTELEGDNYHIYFDSFFSSIFLMEKMKNNSSIAVVQFVQTEKVNPNSKPKKSWDEKIQTALWDQMESTVNAGRIKYV